MGAETRLLILGAKIFAEEVADLAGDIPGIRVAGFVENLDRAHSRELRGLPVHWIDDVAGMRATHRAVCAIGTTKRRGYIEQVEAMGFEFVTLIHPTARVSRSTAVGAGTIVSAGCIVAAHSRIGRHVILNRGTLVGHHTEVGDYATVQPGSNIAGLCRIGAGVYVGIGAIVIDRISIGAGAMIGAGSVVTKNIPERAMAVGMPARVVKSGIEPR